MEFEIATLVDGPWVKLNVGQGALWKKEHHAWGAPARAWRNHGQTFFECCLLELRFHILTFGCLGGIWCGACNLF